MGYYSEYLNMNIASNLEALSLERKKQLQKISSLRGNRDVLVYAADLNKQTNLIAIGYADLLPVSDQLSNLKGKKLDLILETPGGSGEVAEDIVRLLRGKYEEVSVIIPGYAKSAGTIIALSGDEILMGSLSSLGPIDAQMLAQNKQFSADALLEGMEKIKKEVLETGILNRAYVPILQNISPGELQNAQNAMEFARVLVKEWLVKYKFKDWTTHSSDGRPVTPEEKEKRAEEIAKSLSDHSRWKTHAKSLKIQDLASMKLKINDYTGTELEEAILRYYTLLEMTFSSTSIYKVIETVDSQIYRFLAQNTNVNPAQANGAVVEAKCQNCNHTSKIQVDFDQKRPLEAGTIEFPADNKIKCPSCKKEIDLGNLRQQLESQTKKKIV
ncbi:MAG: Clp protease ClpP [Candidatus Moraniibacteriota bacterium]|nr:MAG: Clp protease ClpP [Candidatus Moranbacteria bacterium]